MGLHAAIDLPERPLLARLAPLLEGERCAQGLDNLADDPFFVAFFLASVSQGEGLGEAAVGMIGQEELAGRIRDLDKQEREERGHKEQTIDAARALFPEYFDAGAYRYADRLEGAPYYVAVLEAVRSRLKETDRYSRLNLYLTTTFGYEIMVLLLYRTVAERVRKSTLPPAMREQITRVIDGILAEEETHVGVVDQHNALLAGSRDGLSREAFEMLEALGRLGAEDYAFAAELAVGQVTSMMEKYTEADAYRAEIARGACGEGSGEGAS